MMGSLAAGLLRPKLNELEAKPLALAASLLGSVRLKDVAIETGDVLRVRATFGE